MVSQAYLSDSGPQVSEGGKRVLTTGSHIRTSHWLLLVLMQLINMKHKKKVPLQWKFGMGLCPVWWVYEHYLPRNSLFPLKRFLNKDCLQKASSVGLESAPCWKICFKKSWRGTLSCATSCVRSKSYKQWKTCWRDPAKGGHPGQTRLSLCQNYVPGGRAPSLWSNLHVHTNCIEKHLIMPKSIKRDLPPLAKSGWNNRYKIARTTSPLWKTLPKLDLSKC